MLVLSRELNQDVCIGNEIVVKVLQVVGGKVRLGIEAPKSVPVHRREVKDAIDRDRRQFEKRPA